MNRKKRPKNKKNRDLSRNTFDKNVQKSNDIQQLKSSYEKLKEKYGFSNSEIINILEKDIEIPSSIFNKKIAALETVCKYLKENLNLSNKKISQVTGKSSKSVWQAFNKAKEKHPDKLKVLPSKYFFPISILKNQNLSVLENIVSYLKVDLDLSFSVIARVLKRDDRTIWTVYDRARRKNAKKR